MTSADSRSRSRRGQRLCDNSNGPGCLALPIRHRTFGQQHSGKLAKTSLDEMPVKGERLP